MKAVACAVFGIVALLAFAPFVSAGENDCPAIVPAGAGAIGEPRLCRVGADEPAVCREYRDETMSYLLLFRGGTVPVALYENFVPSAGTQGEALDGVVRSAPVGRCDLERPRGVPRDAQYRGTGVCEDEHGRPLPCSLYEHAGAREPEAMRYFVYYEPDGSGLRRVDALSAGKNEHALAAELAYQIGQALDASGCCRDQARAYAAHAAALFPAEPAYRAGLRAIETASGTVAETDTDYAPDAGWQSAEQSNP